MINKYINYLLILFTFSFPLSIAASNIIIGLLLILWLIEGNFYNKFSIIKSNKILIILVIFFSLLFLSTLFSPVYDQGFLINNRIKNEFGLFKRFIWIGIFYIVFITSANKNTIYKMINAFLIAMFINEIISYSIYFQLINIDYFKKLGLIYTLASSNDPSPMNHSFYSLYLAISIILLIDKLLNNKIKFHFKIFLFLYTLSAIVNLFINGGRTGQLAIIIGLVVYFFTFYRKKAFYMISAFISILIIIFAAYNFSPIFKYKMNTSKDAITRAMNNNYCGSWAMRIGMIKVSSSYLTSSPSRFIFGAGAGVAKKEYIDYGNKYYKDIFHCFNYARTLHNQYLQSWIDGTVFSLILLLYLFYILLKTDNPNRALKYSIVIIFAFSLISDVMIYYSKTYILFLFILLIIQYYKGAENAK